MILYFPGATCFTTNLITFRKPFILLTRNRLFSGGKVATLAISAIPDVDRCPTAITYMNTPFCFNSLALGMVKWGFKVDWPSVTRRTAFLPKERTPFQKERNDIKFLEY